MKPKLLWFLVVFLCVLASFMIFRGVSEDVTDESVESIDDEVPKTIPGDVSQALQRSERIPTKSVKDDAARHWPQWRGPLGTGVAPYADPPVEWSEDKNVRWKVPLPGKGNSTPIVWGGRVFVTAAVPVGDPSPPPAQRPGAHDNVTAIRRHRFVVLAINRKDGRIIWEKAAGEAAPHEGGHHTGSYASASPVTDGERVYAFFGSQGLYCLDWNGNIVWKKDFGDMRTKHGHGEGSSPAVYGDTLVVNWDHEGPSFVVALDKKTGTQLWRRDRDEGSSWSTPIVVEHEEKPQVIISATKRIRGYDLTTGDVIWECGGLSHNVVASPVADDGMVYAGSSYEKRVMLAIRLSGAKGDITGTDRVAWMLNRYTPYVPSPLLYENHLYFLKHYQGILTCLNGKTGKALYGRVRLPGIRNVYASPVAAAGRVYITSQSGVTVVLRHGGSPQVLAVNQLDDGFNASAALVEDELFLRGERYLYCLKKG